MLYIPTVDEILDARDSGKTLSPEPIIKSADSRLMTIYSWASPDQADEVVEPMIDLCDPTYLPMFLRLNQAKLPLNFICDIIVRLAELNRPSILYYTYYELMGYNQSVQTLKVAREFKRLSELNLEGQYYLKKFWFYVSRVLHIKDENSRLISMFASSGLTETILDEWQEEQRQVGRTALKGVHGLANSNSENVIKNRNGLTPTHIVLHSAGVGSPEEYVISLLRGPKAKVSAHFFVTAKGKVYQLVDLKDGACANKTSLDPSDDTYYRFSKNGYVCKDAKSYGGNFNNVSISIETEELGRHGAISTEEFLGVVRTLIFIHDQGYDIPFDRDHVIGHGAVAPLTKSFCPGSSFPIESLINAANRNLTQASIAPVRPIIL